MDSPDNNYAPENVELMRVMMHMTEGHIAAKQRFCEKYPMSDSPTVIMCAYEANDDESFNATDDKSFNIGVLPLFEDDGNDPNHPENVVLDCIDEFPALRFRHMAVCVEGYSFLGNSDTNLEGLDAQYDFENNPFSKVEQNLTIVATDWSMKNLMTCIVPYVWDDNGLPAPVGHSVWCEFTVGDYPHNGMHVLMDALTALATEVKRKVKASSN